ncbi:hypothetical protein ENUP19_0049G0013 [Entamoeba nuttalli]|uniref:Citrate transporter, putative n=2 Tax=Entamoeba nuttalli TaxID=412467 RepID=K2GYG2_ENTNP|nr:citrate transporter, putative [Entamoeba nuttalli P19]EKE40283.1 citrate transporter, putative [Entamoeba nuttalli P19]|eukprot:XP_008857387.1 citrate transporter, putative [Entamoeba nuttalli P19]
MSENHLSISLHETNESIHSRQNEKIESYQSQQENDSRSESDDSLPAPKTQASITSKSEEQIEMEKLKFTEKDITGPNQRSDDTSPIDFGRLVHPALLSASFGNSPVPRKKSPGEETTELIDKKQMVKSYFKKGFSKLFLPLGFSGILSIIFIVMYCCDWKDNYPGQFSAKTAIFLFVFIIMMFILLLEIWHAGIVLMTGVAVLLYCNVISTSQAFSGFSDSGTMTVLCVCIISDAINRTGGLALICSYILPNKEQKWIWPTAIRFVPLFACASVFLNNTPIVAMGISIILGLSKTTKIPASKLLMPMQVAVCVGGMCSLIGTSPNMVAKGLIDSAINGLNKQGVIHIDYVMSLFEVGYVGFPLALIACIYLVFSNKFLLPSHVKTEVKQQLHTFIVPINVVERSPLVGKEIMKTDLGRLSGVALPQILRGNKIIEPNSELQVGDTLFYVCEPSLLIELMNIRGIKFEDPTACNILKHTSTEDLSLYEISFTENSEFNQRNFPTYFEDCRFGILGISNDDKNFNAVKEQPLYFMPVTSNSSYLIITETSFTRSEIYPSPFRIAYELPIKLPYHYPLWKAMIAITSLLIPIILDVCGFYKIIQFSFLSVAALVLTGVLTVKQVYNAVSVSLVCTLGASFGLSAAMQNTNTGYLIAMTLIKLLTPLGRIGILFGIGIPTMVLTQVLSNNATIAVMFPVVWSAYLGSDPTGLTRGNDIGLRSAMVTMMICANSCFFLPFGYQTNLMVMKDGGYKVKHYMIYGIFLSLLYVIGSALLSYFIFEKALDPI